MEPTTAQIGTLEFKGDTVFVKGAIDFNNVVSLWQQGIDAFNALEKKAKTEAEKELKNITIDLQELKQSNSSGLALLIDWMRFLKEKNKTIKFIHMPNFMQDVLKVYGLESVL